MHTSRVITSLFSCFVFLALLKAGPSHAIAETVMVKNVNTRHVPAPASGLVDVNGALFFTVTDPNGGQELWKSDGTEDGTVLVREFDSIKTDFLASAKGRLFFYAVDSSQKGGLWISDGTEAGTVMLRKNIRTSALAPEVPISVRPDFVVTGEGMLYFRADDGMHGWELWKSDGTESGTCMVKDIHVPDSSYPSSLAAIGETIYFFATDVPANASIYYDLWKSDGTENGTGRVKRVYNAPSWPLYTLGKIITSIDGTLYFFVNDGLWTSDGTEAGTKRIKDVNAQHLFERFLTAMDKTLYFAAGDESYGAITGVELWKSDGTENGTGMVKDINPLGSSYPRFVINLNGTLYFSADDSSHGRELWRSDGTEAGTFLLKDINAEPVSVDPFPDPAVSGYGDPQYLTIVNGTLYFAADDSIHGRELWKSDGTEQGTVMVKDINDNGSAAPTELIGFNGMLYFIVSGTIWKSDGSGAGTVLVKAVTKDAASNPIGLTSLNGKLYFSADDGLDGQGLWQSNGTEAGTIRVKPVAFNTLSKVNEVLYGVADDGIHGKELWKSDGTDPGTIMVEDINPAGDSNPSHITDVGGTLYFYADDGSSKGRELWKSDLTETGTVPVKNINPFPDQGSVARLCWQCREAPQLTSFNGKLFFAADDGIHGPDLWVSNGTRSGTLLFKNVFPYSILFGNPWFHALTASPNNLIEVNGELYFTSAYPAGLWKTNGSRIGTFFVKKIAVDPIHPCSINGTLYFTQFNSLWKSNGTGPGTVMIKTFDLQQDEIPTGESINLLTNVNGTLYFVRTRYFQINVQAFPLGRELWKSDGTEGGTVLVKALDAGNLFNVNGTLYFTGNDGICGNELWKSDGTEAGTVLVADINPTGSSDPGGFTIAGNMLYFIANDGSHGRELWKTSLSE